jgi:1-acyl-sn-glycerol-3-phosphate acyltransferase
LPAGRGPWTIGGKPRPLVGLSLRRGKETAVWAARWRLASLWLSQVGRVAADACLGAFVVLEVGGAEHSGAWQLVAALLVWPVVLLAPVNGALANGLPKRWVLAGAAAFCVAVTVTLGMLAGAWIICWALVAVGSAVYGPARYALLPAAAQDARVPLTRVNGFMQAGMICAVVGGCVLGARLHDQLWLGYEAAAADAAALSLVCLLAAVPVWFTADVRRREAGAAALAGFFRDGGRIAHGPGSLSSVLGLTALRGLLLGTVGALLAVALGQGVADERLLGVGLWLAVGVAAGSLLAGVQRHQRRALGLVPLGATGLVLGLLLAAAGVAPGWALLLLLGFSAGLAGVPLAAKYQPSVPADARGNALAIAGSAAFLLAAALAGILLGLVSAAARLWLVTALAAVGTVVGWWALARNCAEQVLEWLIWPLYRIRGHGPGFDHFPLRGPALVVANHSAWLDPLWLGKVVPRKLTPMMTSMFYDLPGLRWLMKTVVGAIRVQAATYRREAPEIQEAIRTLDHGGCVVIFPEGYLRRSDAALLRPFGQGVWHILRERPETVVVVCWIQGGWGSFFSYFGGPPTKNKRMDVWRRIDVAAGEPQLLKPEVLADLRATRTYLRRLCLETRRYLGLAPVTEEGMDEEPAEESPQGSDAPSGPRA